MTHDNKARDELKRLLTSLASSDDEGSLEVATDRANSVMKRVDTYAESRVLAELETEQFSSDPSYRLRRIAELTDNQERRK
jgi:hypothetical protein